MLVLSSFYLLLLSNIIEKKKKSKIGKLITICDTLIKKFNVFLRFNAGFIALSCENIV